MLIQKVDSLQTKPNALFVDRKPMFYDGKKVVPLEMSRYGSTN